MKLLSRQDVVVEPMMFRDLMRTYEDYVESIDALSRVTTLKQARDAMCMARQLKHAFVITDAFLAVYVV